MSHLQKNFFLFVLLLLFMPSTALGTILEGRVFSTDGPLKGITIYVFKDYNSLIDEKPLMSSSPTDERGYYQLQVPEGEYYVTAKGRNDGKDFFSYHGKNPLWIETKNIWLAFMANEVKSHLYSQGETSVKGVVTYKGKPVQGGATLSFYNLENKSFKGLGVKTEQTAENGTFNVSIPSGNYVIIARKHLSSAIPATNDENIQKHGRNAEQTKDRGIFAPTSSKREAGSLGIKGGDNFGPIKNGGMYCYYALNPLNVPENTTVSIEIPCYPRGERESFTNIATIKNNDYLTVKQLAETGKTGISGRVTNVDGTPLAGINLFAYRGDPTVALINKKFYRTEDIEFTVKTDSKGYYFIPLTADGYYYIVARGIFSGMPKDSEIFGLYKQGIIFKKGLLIDKINIMVKANSDVSN